MRPKQDSPAAVFLVLPSSSLRALVRKHAEHLVPGCNYILEWRDTHGYGIELCRAEAPQHFAASIGGEA